MSQLARQKVHTQCCVICISGCDDVVYLLSTPRLFALAYYKQGNNAGLVGRIIRSVDLGKHYTNHQGRLVAQTHRIQNTYSRHKVCRGWCRYGLRWLRSLLASY